MENNFEFKDPPVVVVRATYFLNNEYITKQEINETAKNLIPTVENLLIKGGFDIKTNGQCGLYVSGVEII